MATGRAPSGYNNSARGGSRGQSRGRRSGRGIIAGRPDVILQPGAQERRRRHLELQRPRIHQDDPGRYGNRGRGGSFRAGGSRGRPSTGLAGRRRRPSAGLVGRRRGGSSGGSFRRGGTNPSQRRHDSNRRTVARRRRNQAGPQRGPVTNRQGTGRPMSRSLALRKRRGARGRSGIAGSRYGRPRGGRGTVAPRRGLGRRGRRTQRN